MLVLQSLYLEFRHFYLANKNPNYGCFEAILKIKFNNYLVANLPHNFTKKAKN